MIDNIKKGPVLVAMSGGVDSSVVAAILKDQGYDVIGMTMQIWQESQVDPRKNGCCSLGAVEDARRVARKLNIPFYVVNYKDEFKKDVIDYFIEEYANGRTPNPCVECNRKVKFDHLYKKMKELGCTHLATGHYASIVHHPDTDSYHLKRSKNTAKDQSYVLYSLNQQMLSSILFPLGEMENKEDIRKLAEHYQLPVARKPDSQEICFVSEAGGYSEFLKKNRPELFKDQGDLVNTKGEKIGSHQGTSKYTIGQRKGIGVSGPKPLYVIDIKPKINQIVIGEKENLKTRKVLIDQVHITIPKDQLPLKVTAKIRYNMTPAPATLYCINNETYLEFDEDVSAPTPGQIAVAYNEFDIVIAGGIIEKSPSTHSYLS